MFEVLESRKLLAATVSASGGTLLINGTNSVDVITVHEQSHNVLVETSVPGGPITQQNFTGITAIKINGNGAGDTIFYTGNTVGADIHGDNANLDKTHNGKGKGNKGGSGGSGGTGGTGGGTGGGPNFGANDMITVTDEGTGSSSVNGDGGNDSLVTTIGNNTVLRGGSGNDQFYLNTLAQGGSNSAFGEEGDDIFTVYSGINTVNGGSGFDTLIKSATSTNSSTSIEQTFTF